MTVMHSFGLKVHLEWSVIICINYKQVWPPIYTRIAKCFKNCNKACWFLYISFCHFENCWVLVKPFEWFTFKELYKERLEWISVFIVESMSQYRTISKSWYTMEYNICTCDINNCSVSHKDFFQTYVSKMKAKKYFVLLRKGKFCDMCSNMTRIRRSKS